MKPVTRSAKPDLRRIVTCATLATITSFGMFSLVVNVMATLVGGMTGRATAHAGQEVRVALTPSPVVCADSAHVEGVATLPLQAI
jgi:hypothetical protein